VYKIGVGWDEGKYGSKLPVSNILAGKVWSFWLYRIVLVEFMNITEIWIHIHVSQIVVLG
jgi:hypothetical protein